MLTPFQRREVTRTYLGPKCGGSTEPLQLAHVTGQMFMRFTLKRRKWKFTEVKTLAYSLISYLCVFKDK